MSSLEERAREIAVKIVEEIHCPDYGMHRETEAFKKFFTFLNTEIVQFAREEVLIALKAHAEAPNACSHCGEDPCKGAI